MRNKNGDWNEGGDADTDEDGNEDAEERIRIRMTEARANQRQWCEG